MTGVEYRGQHRRMLREVAKGEYLDVNVPGNEVFWASNQILTSNRDVPITLPKPTSLSRLTGASFR